MSVFDPARGFGVYVHWPYCARICPYCDFNVYAARARDSAPLFETVLRDLEGWRARTGARQADTVFLGGGTPSLLTGEQVARLLQEVDRLWGLKTRAEVTLEANPNDAARFADFAAAGVNRLSLGVQSFDDDRLRFLGRTHCASEALVAFEKARAMFGSVSIDIIYALPGQTHAQWRDELARALALGADHLSLYELSIEPGTAFFRAVQRRAFAPASEDVAADLYELTQELAGAAGYPAYEISNHARGIEHQSAHNRIYWSSGDWAGVGPGAHGRLTTGDGRWATVAAERPPDYQKQVALEGVGWAAADRLDALAEARERVAMGLRVAEGIPADILDELGLTLRSDALAELAAQGLIVSRDGRVALTAAGRLLADRIASEIAP